MNRIFINHDDAPEWVTEKFIDGIRRLGLTVTDVSDPNKTVCEYRITGSPKAWIVYDTFTSNNAYFTSASSAEQFVEANRGKDPKERYHIREIQLDAPIWQ